MSERIDLQEFVAGFIAESDELVAAANALLLEIEAANLAGATKPRAIRELFRALHTLKGLAGMVGVEPIVELAHALEGLVRTADRAGTSLSAEAVEAALRGIAAIGERVRAVDAQHAPAPVPSELVDAIAAAAGKVTATSSAARTRSASRRPRMIHCTSPARSISSPAPSATPRRSSSSSPRRTSRSPRSPDARPAACRARPARSPRSPCRARA